jgi:hypothetical protein
VGVQTVAASTSEENSASVDAARQWKRFAAAAAVSGLLSKTAVSWLPGISE